MNQTNPNSSSLFSTSRLLPTASTWLLAVGLALGTTLAACDSDDGMSPGTDTMTGGDTMTGDTMTGDDAGPDDGVMARGADDPPAIGVQIDRLGRPAIATALVATFEADDATKGDRKDEYNAAVQADWAGFSADFAGSLAILDALDATCGNQLLAAADGDPADRYATLVSVLIDDQLYLHADRTTCGVYLGLEAEVVGALAAGDGACGGRIPSDDVIERSYSVLAAGLLAGVDDGIAADDAPASTSFPFLSAPTN